MYEVHEAFESQKEEFKKKEDMFKEQEKTIQKKDWAIQADLIHFCSFLQENEAKKIRAEKRLVDERNARKAKEEEIETLNESIKKLNLIQSLLETKVN